MSEALKVALEFGVLDYRLSLSEEKEDLIGKRVEVEVRGRKKWGVVVGWGEEHIPGSKEINKVVDRTPPYTYSLLKLTRRVCEEYFLPWGKVLRNVLPLYLRNRPLKEELSSGRGTPSDSKFSVALCTHPHNRFRWERFLEEIEKIEKGTILVIFPEWDGYGYLREKLLSRFSSEVIFLSPRLSPRKAFEIWKKVYQGEVRILAGTGKSVFFPLPDLRLVLVEDIHSSAYKSKRHPYYWIPYLAELRGEVDNTPVILSSPVPPIKYLHALKKGKIEEFKVNRSFFLPRITLVNMRREKKKNKSSGVSSLFLERVSRYIEEGNKVAILVSRKGYAGYKICSRCRYVIRCKTCGIPLSFHKPDRMICNICGKEETFVPICPRCQGSYTRDRSPGIQKVEEYLKRNLPGVRIVRIEGGKIDKFLSPPFILLGTSGIIPFLREDSFNLLVISQADIHLYQPHYLSSERTFRYLGELVSLMVDEGKEVVVQSYHSENEILKMALQLELERFYVEEIKLREELGYPPSGCFISLRIKGKNPVRVERSAIAVQDFFSRRGLTVLGLPRPTREKGGLVSTLMVKGSSREDIRKDIKSLLSSQRLLLEKGVSILLDIHPDV